MTRVLKLRDSAYANRKLLRVGIQVSAAAWCILFLLVFTGLGFLVVHMLSGGKGFKDFADIFYLDASIIPLFSFLTVFGLGIFINQVLVLINVHRFWDKQYTQVWRGLCHSELGRVLGEKEFLRPFYLLANKILFMKYMHTTLNERIEDHITFTAVFHQALAGTAAGSGRVKRLHVLRGLNQLSLWERAVILKQIPVIIFSIVVLAVVSLFGSVLGSPRDPFHLASIVILLLILLFLFTDIGSKRLLVMVNIVAFCDFLLDEPQVDVDTLEWEEPHVSRLEEWWTNIIEWLYRRYPPLY